MKPLLIDRRNEYVNQRPLVFTTRQPHDRPRGPIDDDEYHVFDALGCSWRDSEFRLQITTGGYREGQKERVPNWQLRKTLSTRV